MDSNFLLGVRWTRKVYWGEHISNKKRSVPKAGKNLYEHKLYIYIMFMYLCLYIFIHTCVSRYAMKTLKISLMRHFPCPCWNIRGTLWNGCISNRKRWPSETLELGGTLNWGGGPLRNTHQEKPTAGNQKLVVSVDVLSFTFSGNMFRFQPFSFGSIGGWTTDGKKETSMKSMVYQIN